MYERGIQIKGIVQQKKPTASTIDRVKTANPGGCSGGGKKKRNPNHKGLPRVNYWGGGKSVLGSLMGGS